MSSTTTRAPSVILIAGPGGLEQDVAAGKAAFDRHNIRYTTIGDGTNDCTESMIAEGIEQHANGWTGENVTIIVSAHGGVQWGEHHLKMERGRAGISTDAFIKRHLASGDTSSDGPGTSYRTLQERLSKRQNQIDHSCSSTAQNDPQDPKIDLFLASCSSWAALPLAELLPTGSTMVVESDAYAYTSNLTSMLLELSARATGVFGDFSAKHLLQELLLIPNRARSDARNPPSYAISTSDAISKSCSSYYLARRLYGRLGTPFTDEQMRTADEEWGERVGRERLRDLMEKIGTAESEHKVGNKDYWLALALSDRFSVPTV